MFFLSSNSVKGTKLHKATIITHVIGFMTHVERGGEEAQLGHREKIFANYTFTIGVHAEARGALRGAGGSGVGCVQGR